MIYEYKKLGIRVIANSKEEAIENILKAPKYKITAMSFDRDKLEKEIRFLKRLLCFLRIPPKQ